MFTRNVVDTDLVQGLPDNKILIFRGDQIETARAFAARKDALRVKNLKMVVINCDSVGSRHENIEDILWCKNESVDQTWRDIRGRNADFIAFWNHQLGLVEEAVEV